MYAVLNFVLHRGITGKPDPSDCLGKQDPIQRSVWWTSKN